MPQGYEQTQNKRVVYTQSSQKYELVNQHVPSRINIQVRKTWEDAGDQDGLRPDEIVVHLLKNGEDTGKQLTLTEQDNWAAKTFKDLDEYANGVKIDYTVKEDAVVGYEANVEEEKENVFAITNTHVPGKISVSVSKIWEDDGDRDGLRPDKITVNLLADGKFLQSKEIMPDAQGVWSSTFEDLDQYRDHGVKIDYTITEDGTEGYTTEISGDAQNGFTVTNTHEPEKISLVVNKTWEDADDQDGIRPESVTVRLWADGEPAGAALTLSADSGWKAAFEDLPVYRKGEAIAYTVTEDEVEGYVAEITGSAEHGFVIKNTHEPDPVKPEPTDTPHAQPTEAPAAGNDEPAASPVPTAQPAAVPQTGDPNPVGLWLVLLALSGLGLTTVALLRVRSKRG